MNAEPLNSHCRWAEEREANWQEWYAAHEQPGPDWRAAPTYRTFLARVVGRRQPPDTVIGDDIPAGAWTRQTAQGTEWYLPDNPDDITGTPV